MQQFVQTYSFNIAWTKFIFSINFLDMNFVNDSETTFASVESIKLWSSGLTNLTYEISGGRKLKVNSDFSSLGDISTLFIGY